MDEIYHLASPASPPHYMYNPVKTIKTNTVGTVNMLGLAKRTKARILIASTSEVYGDPEVHPQPETYWGHVNPIGPRACYDEGKRVAETLAYAYEKQSGVEVSLAPLKIYTSKIMIPDVRCELREFSTHMVLGCMPMMDELFPILSYKHLRKSHSLYTARGTRLAPSNMYLIL